jgi:exopolyphosphatase/guanosine-5'-triphosphate,3'-diphosphate pyrophosphatase
MKRPRSQVLAAIDIGTNAARVKLARVGRSGTIAPIHQQRDTIRPGEGVFSTGLLSHSVVDRLAVALRQYAEMCRLQDARVRAVATSAFREARNALSVVERLQDEVGLPIEVISAEEEARLACLGALAGTIADRASICLDVGGGSTEVIFAHGERPAHIFGLPIGTVRLAESVSSAIAAGELAGMREAARAAVAALPREGWGPRIALGCSGTVRAIVQFATAGTRGYATRDELARTVVDLFDLGPALRRRIFEPRRADTVVAGAVIVDAVAERLELDSVRGVKRGLRDGILVELSRDPVRGQRLPAAVRATSSRRLARPHSIG